jgi:hypothetical protein
MSRVFGIDKSIALTNIRKELHFNYQGQVFMRGTSTKEEIIKTGGQVGEVKKLRQRRFYDKTMSSTATVQQHTFPPIARATKYHSFRVYHQIQIWSDEKPNISADQWG